MRGPGSEYVYSVERELGGPGYADISLVRRPRHHGLLGHLSAHDHPDAVVLFHRIFKPRLEVVQLEAYANLLERVAAHANGGTLGCFVETASRDGSVWITLYERWFDGNRLQCDELAQRTFDPDEASALVASAEFVAELEAWAERRNEERDASYLEAAAEDEVRTERAIDRASAANELAGILNSLRGRGRL